MKKYLTFLPIGGMIAKNEQAMARNPDFLTGALTLLAARDIKSKADYVKFPSHPKSLVNELNKITRIYREEEIL